MEPHNPVREPVEPGRTAVGSNEAALRALVQRPKLSIRLRIALGFLLTFVLICLITISGMVFVTELGSRQRFLEKAGTYVFEIQQARRFEKNYFLYGTDLYDALNHVHTAENLIETNGEDFRSILGDHSYSSMSVSLQRYRELLESLATLSQGADSVTVAVASIEPEIRRVGAEIVADASNAIDQERLRVNTLMATSQVVAVATLIFMLLFIAFLSAFITRQIIRPFARFRRYTERIAAGDFSPITPARKYRDEFTNLAIAINRMSHELNTREEQLIESRKMAAVGTLTAGIAHELNNPLNNISLTTESLIDEFDEWNREEKLKMLDDIFTQVGRASATVRNLLDFTRRDTSSFETLNLSDIIRSTSRLLENEISLHNIQLKLELDETVPLVRGSYHNLQQVFLNLFLNAIQAMPGGGELRVGSVVRDETLDVEVSDTGIGIPQEQLGKVFDPFFTTKEPGEGTGLGLSVTFGIVEQHNGTITVSSKVGEGTTFKITLPLVRENDGGG